MRTDVETNDGMLFDKGYISPYMVTDSERMEAVLTDPYILVTERKIGDRRISCRCSRRSSSRSRS